ncbi:MAG: MATE family efflux transporter [Christensenella sp.]|nr:MATE family efflux transporter [Christensenella sp.]
MEDKRIYTLKDAPVTKAIFKMTMPVVAGMMIQILYNLVDTFFISQLGDPNQLAAANLTMPVFMIMMAIASIIGTGAASYISRCLGEKDYSQANRTLSTGIAICVGLGIIITILGYVFLSPLMYALGSSPATFPFAKDYSSVLFLGSVFIMCNYAIGQLLRSEGAVMPSIIGMMIGTVANIILDPLFIFGFNMGIRGAAIATVIGNALGLLYYVVYYAKGKSIVKFSIKCIAFSKEIMKQIFGIGLPAALSQLLMSVAMIICNNLLAAYGDTVVAGYGVAYKIMSIGTFVFMGFAAGCQPLTGYNYGAKNLPRLKEIIKKAMLFTFLIGVGIFAIFGIFAAPLVGVFSTNMPEVERYGISMLRALMWLLLVLGIQLLCTTTIQAFGKIKAALFLSIARQGLFFIPLLFIMNNLIGLNGVIYAQPLADGLTFIVALLVLRHTMKQIEQSMQHPQEV